MRGSLRIVCSSPCWSGREWYLGSSYLSSKSHFHKNILTNNRGFTQSQESEAKINSTATRPHIPVMVSEVVKFLDPTNKKVFVDMTYGAGGHTRSILEKASNATIYVLDRDPVAHRMAQEFSKTHNNVIPLLGKFSDLHILLAEHGVNGGSIDGFLFDVGASSMQFDSDERGFSLSKDAPLDMRMDGESQSSNTTAEQVVNNAKEDDLYEIIRKYGEDKHARDIARCIVESRLSFGKITSTKQLARIVELTYEGFHKTDQLGRHAHAATKTFQALRIFVNNELNELNNGLKLAYHYLNSGGVCVAVAFHSLEDRIIKRHFHGIDMNTKINPGLSDHLRNANYMFSYETMDELQSKQWQPISRRVLKPSELEVKTNPRSRSAKLRAAYKI